MFTSIGLPQFLLIVAILIAALLYGRRANRPTRSTRAAANASPPPAMVIKAPIFI